MEKVSVIVPLHNRAELTVKCFDALSRSTEYPDWELIAVDNGSTDDTLALLSALQGDVVTLRAEDNLGFARACNWGASVAAGELLCFLNNDTEAAPGWLTAMVDCLRRHPGASGVGGKLLFPDGTIQHAGVVFDKIDRIGYHVYRGLPADAPQVSRERRVRAVTGACMLVKKRAFNTVGGFDERYVNGFEDIDLCLKLGEINGEIYYTPDCRVVHHTSATPGRKDADLANADLFRRRWFDKIEPDEDVFLAEDGYRAVWRGTTCILKEVTCGVIIHSHDNLPAFKRCLYAIRRNTRYPRYEILVVDSGSADGTEEYLQTMGDGLEFIYDPTAVNFSAACNRGAEAMKTDLLAFLDCDTEPQPGWLTELVKASVPEEVFACGSMMKYPNEVVHSREDVFSHTASFEHSIMEIPPGCLLVKRERFIEMGMFDDKPDGDNDTTGLFRKFNMKGGIIRHISSNMVLFISDKF